MRVELRNHGGHFRCLKPNPDLVSAVEVVKVLVSGLNGVAGESGNISQIQSPLLSGGGGGVATAVPATGAAGDHPFNMSHIPSPLLLAGSPLWYQRLVRLVIPLIIHS